MEINITEIKNLISNSMIFNIKLGDSRYDIIGILGNPIDIAHQKKSSPEILSYGALQFYLKDNKLRGFSFYSSKIGFYNNIYFQEIHKSDIINFVKKSNYIFFENKSFLNEDVIYTINGIDYLFSNNILISFGIFKDFS
ncbi:MAG: hypothetical protein Q4D05_05600 [Acinetobacter sp.]|nr:hypothetical protein [Acinetobacter sp.]